MWALTVNTSQNHEGHCHSHWIFNNSGKKPNKHCNWTITIPCTITNVKEVRLHYFMGIFILMQVLDDAVTLVKKSKTVDEEDDINNYSPPPCISL